LGISYQQALYNYVSDTLGGQILASQYSEGGSGRINVVPAAPVFLLMLSGFAVVGLRRLVKSA